MFPRQEFEQFFNGHQIKSRLDHYKIYFIDSCRGNQNSELFYTKPSFKQKILKDFGLQITASEAMDSIFGSLPSQEEVSVTGAENQDNQFGVGINQNDDPIVNAINQENILPKVDDGNGPLVVININAENADINGDIDENPNVQTNVNESPAVIENNFVPDIIPTIATEPAFNLRYRDFYVS